MRKEQLLERDSELAELTDMLLAARRGQGQMAVIEGPAGIGKTTMLAWLRGLAGRNGMAVLRARAGELEREFPFAVARQLLEPALAAEHEQSSLLSGAAAAAAPVLAAGGSVAAGPSPDTQAVLHGLYWVVANLTAREPLLLAVDDVHWSDRPSLEMLSYLLRRLEGLPLLIAIAARPSEPGAADDLISILVADASTRTFRPRALSQKAVARIVRAELGADAEDEFCNACHAAGGGNPFVVRELIRELRSTGSSGAAAQAKLVAELQPETVSRSVLLRLSRLPEGSVALARAASVLGDGVEIGLAGELAGLGQPAAAEAADGLARADVVEPAPGLMFLHPVLRRAVYDDLAPSQRIALHARAARLLAARGAEPEAIAAHLLMTEARGDEWAVTTLRVAADASLARGASAAAATYLRRALAEPPSPEEHARVMLRLAEAEALAGELRAVEHFMRALELDKRLRLSAPALRQLAFGLVMLSGPDDVLGQIDLAIDAVKEADPDLALDLEAQAITALQRHGRSDEAARRIARLPPVGEGDSTPGARALLAVMAYQQWMEGSDHTTAAALAQRALTQGLVADQRGESSVLSGAVEVLVAADLVEPAAEANVQAMALARERGSALGFIAGSFCAALIARLRGDLDELEASARSVIEALETMGLPLAVAAAMPAFVVDALLERGDLPGAAAELERAGLDGELPDLAHRHGAILLHSRARLRLAQGHPERAAKELEQALELERSRGVRLVPTLRSELALVRTRLGDADEALRLLEEELASNERWGQPSAIGRTLRARGLLTGGEGGIDDLEESVRRLSSSPARLERARALIDLGAALRRANRRAAARGPLESGLEHALACGATVLAQHAADELAASGVKVAPVVRGGRDALTPSERRIAEMAAKGMPNPEIAQSLFVTRKTIEMHLSRAYRKLGISSRAELPEALADGRGNSTGSRA